MTETAAAATPATHGTLAQTVARARRQTLGDLLHRSARRFPERVAVLEDGDGGRSRTYAELDAETNRIAQALAARGIRPGDRVALLSRNGLPYVQAIFGVAKAGATLVPINFMLGGAEVAYVLEHAGAVGMLVQDALLGVADDAIAQAIGSAERLKVRAVLGADDVAAHGDWEPFPALAGQAGDPDPGVPELVIASDALAQVMYTSGTESRPKGAALSHEALIANYSTCMIDGSMTSDDVQLHALPLFHVAQQHVFLVPAIQLGMTNVLLPAPDPATVLAAIQRHRATMFFAPPTVWISLLGHPGLAEHDLSTLRKGYYGAAIMPVEVLRELSRRLPDVQLWNFYGQTEMAPLATVLKPEDQLRKAGSAGRAALNVEARVVDAAGRELPPGEVGELVFRSPHAILEYLGAPDKTAEAFAGGWFHSGDLGVVDDEGYFTVVDRIKDMIKTGGENVASREVEEAVYTHPAVAEVAVIGIPHPQWIEAVVALVVLREGEEATHQDLTTHARDQLAGFKVPKIFRVVAALPKNASGKILKRALRDQHADAADEIPGPKAR